MKNLNQIILQVKNGEHGLDIYIGKRGNENYVTTRRRNGLLWVKLKDGVTLGELQRVKPNYTRAEQKYYHYSRYLLKLADDYIKDDYIKYDLVA